MRGSRSLASATVALGLLTTACTTPSVFRTATTVDEGEFEPSLEISGLLAVVDRSPIPYLAFSLRYGVSDRVDIGGHLGAFDGGLSVGIRLSEIDAPVIVTLAPRVGWAGHWGHLRVPVLVGLRLPSGTEFVFTAQAYGEVGEPALGEPTVSFSLGAAAGVSLELGPVRLLPELSVIAPVYGLLWAQSDEIGNPAFFRQRTVVFQAGVAMSW